MDADGGSLAPWGAAANSGVWAIQPTSDGQTVYIGGAFTTVGGKARRRLAAIDVGGASLEAWNPGANGTVRVLDASTDVVYAGGQFGTIGGETRRGVAALDPVTGKATGWDAGGNGNVFTLALAGDAIYVGGRFTSIGGSSRKSIAALDIGDGSALRWDVSPDDDVDVIGIAPDGTEMIVGGDFTKIAGGRRDLAAFDLSTGFLTDWRPIAPFTALALAFGQGAATLFVGGDSELLVFGQST